MGDCPSDTDLDRYHAGDMAEARAAEIRDHLASCDACARRDAALVAEHDELVQYVRRLGSSGDLVDVLKAPASGSPDGPVVGGIRGDFDGSLDLQAPLPPRGIIEGYEIVRELHRGGQGVVYQAIEKSAKRKVAIKVLLEGPFASKSARRRFEREIELIANLRHPNIVTVFHSGVTSDRRQYCVMDYVRGLRLDQYVQEEKPSLEEALRLFVTVCQAVNHAHQKGIIHRDLKPSNIIVDTEGNPKVLDFGLAKQLGGGAETLLSMTGQVVGTLPYLSPEVAKGHPDEVDIRTDVYALGVILYEMLTGQYPYPVVGEVVDVLKHITDMAPAPPSKVWSPESGIVRRTHARGSRQHGCPVDHEVETIIFKALAKQRERRYQSALELARDIEHYLAGEPIEAKRDSSWYVFKKTVRRYKLAVAVAAMFGGLIVASSITLSIMYGAAKDSWREAETQAQDAKAKLERALTAEARAKQRFEQVRELANAFIFDFHDAIVELPGSTPARELLVKTALTYLDSLAEEAGDDLLLQRELAAAYSKVGDVQGSVRRANLGDTAGAMRSYQKTMEILEKLHAAEPDDDRLVRDVGLTLGRVGDMYWVTGRTEEALAQYERAKEMAQAVCDRNPDYLPAKRTLAIGYQDVGDTLIDMGKTEEALANYREALRLVEALAQADPTSAEARSDSAMFHDKVGLALLKEGQTEEAMTSLREAMEIRKALLLECPTNARLRSLLAGSYDHLGDIHDFVGQEDEALEYYRQSLEIRKALAEVDPTNAKARRDLAISYNRVGVTEAKVGQTDAALANAHKALDIRKEAVASDPSNARLQGDLATSYDQIARLEASAGETEAALRDYGKAAAVWEALSEADPANASLQENSANSCTSLGDILTQTGKTDEAVRYYDKAIDVYEAVLLVDPSNATVRRDLANAHDRLAVLLSKTDRIEQSVAHFQRSLSLSKAAAEAEPDSAETQRGLALRYYKLAHVNVLLANRNQGSKADHIEQTRAAIDWYAKSHAVFSQMRDRGMLAEEEASFLEDIEATIAACRAALAQLLAGEDARLPKEDLTGPGGLGTGARPQTEE
ncbi:MAG: protein kinase [Phycisphaerae bacterium]|nr:protein kinase [Phycisphaerae bacterium]